MPHPIIIVGVAWLHEYIVAHRRAGKSEGKYAMVSLQWNKARIWFLAKGSYICTL